MKIFFQIVASLLLLIWPFAIMYIYALVTMSMGSQASQPVIPTFTWNNLSYILWTAPLLLFPLIVAFIFHFFDADFWGLQPKLFVKICMGICFVAYILYYVPKSFNFREFQKFLNKEKPFESYAIEDGKVYFNGKKIKADAKTFKTLASDVYFFAYDAEHMFQEGEIIEGVSSKNLIYKDDISPTVIITDSTVFVDYKILKEALPASFEIIKFNGTSSEWVSFFKDARNVYYHTKILEGLNPSKVVLLSESYIKDDKVIYFDDRKIPNVDVQSFEVFKGCRIAKDKNNVYYMNFAVPKADAATFEVLGRGYYGKDKNKVFAFTNNLSELIIELNEVDVKKFKLESKSNPTSDANDGKNYFYLGHKVNKL